MKIKQYLTEAKPKKGDVILTLSGDKYKIHTVSRGIVYADTGEIERFVVGLSDVKRDPKGGKFWVETIGGRSYYDYK